MTKKPSQFPIVEALLLTPSEAKTGAIGICTNTQAAGQVQSEIKDALRPHVSVYGSLIVSRGGAERMILNSIVHPSLNKLILFGEESRTFQPSANLLQALQHGFDPAKRGNYIKGDLAASGHYPNLSKEILDMFRDRIQVLPIFISPNAEGKQIVQDYLKWLKPHISKDLFVLLSSINSSKKIYYDVLNDVIELISKEAAPPKEVPYLNPADFKHLQPPVSQLKEAAFSPPKTPFYVSIENDAIRVDLKIKDTSYYIKDADEFSLGFSLMRFLGDNKKQFSPLQQLLLGAEVGRVSTQLMSGENYPAFIQQDTFAGSSEIKIQPQTALKTDSHYYYNVGVKKNELSVACLAFDECEDVFELRAVNTETILLKLAELNRFEDYEMDFLHRFDVGIQVARAGIALKGGYIFAQDFKSIIKVNTTELPHFVVDGDSFGAVHQAILRRTFTEGLTEAHGDTHKGTARTANVLAIFRASAVSLKTLPQVYAQGDTTTTEMRKDYKAQLLRFDHDGTYSYGERTRSFFGHDQLQLVAAALKKNPARAAIIQRFDPSVDMSLEVDPDTGKQKATHDPCLTHDIFFLSNNVLHAFHIARAHNLVNAYPENIFGLHDAYDTTLAKELKAELGDMFMLSSRGNILLLTEDQRTKKLLAESVKPRDDKIDISVGPYKWGKNIVASHTDGTIYYRHAPLKKQTVRPADALLAMVENYRGVNTLERAIDYLKRRGGLHNNPILTTFDAREDDPQSEQLVFFQANVMGGTLHVTAVYANRALAVADSDINVCSYIATRYADGLNVPLGSLTYYTIITTDNHA